MILVVCALAAELPGFEADERIEILPCGLGLVEAAAATAQALAARPYSAVINAGIAGVFRACGRVGDAYVVGEETLADVGWEDGTAPALPQGAALPLHVRSSRELLALARALPHRVVRGLTVPRVTTTNGGAQRLRSTYDAEVESMEGFAVLRAAERAGVPAIEVRGVSNIVGPRAEGEWDFRAGAQAGVSALRVLLGVLNA